MLTLLFTSPSKMHIPLSLFWIFLGAGFAQERQIQEITRKWPDLNNILIELDPALGSQSTITSRILALIVSAITFWVFASGFRFDYSSCWIMAGAIVLQLPFVERMMDFQVGPLLEAE